MTNQLDTLEISNNLFQNLKSFSDVKLPGEELVFKESDQLTLVCQHIQAEQDSPVVLYFPAIEDDSATLETQGGEFKNHGISSIYVFYRGSGKSSGTPSPSNCIEDANYLIGAVRQWLDRTTPETPLFVMGKSLGSVFAIDAASKNSEKIKGLILESSLCLTEPYLKGIGVDTATLDIDEKAGFNTLEKIADIKLATIIFHGARDPLVNSADAESLQSHSGAKSKQFFIIPGGGHGDLQIVGGKTYYKTLKTFLDTTCGINTWRHRRRKQRNQ